MILFLSYISILIIVNQIFNITNNSQHVDIANTTEACEETKAIIL